MTDLTKCPACVLGAWQPPTAPGTNILCTGRPGCLRAAGTEGDVQSRHIPYRWVSFAERALVVAEFAGREPERRMASYIVRARSEIVRLRAENERMEDAGRHHASELRLAVLAERARHHSEIARLRAEVKGLTKERDEARGLVADDGAGDVDIVDMLRPMPQTPDLISCGVQAKYLRQAANEIVRDRAEITRLRAEVERLTAIAAILGPKVHCKTCGTVVPTTGPEAFDCDCRDADEVPRTPKYAPHDESAMATIASLRAENARLTKERDDARVKWAENEGDVVALTKERDEARHWQQDGDQEDEWTPLIKAAHPGVAGKNHDEYATAMRMIRPRHSKGSLVSLVSWILADRHARDTTMWRTMESAPRDGTKIIAVNKYGEVVVGVKWDVDRQMWVEWGQDGFDNMAWVRADRPDHWMPMPAPPAARSAGEDGR